ncbi:MAG: hypothetical protein QF839_01985 [Candidatus Poseidoniaceae archaeon]|nr:hypothetical protein [Candidatus Poseidoniaceae archaeon]
MQDDALKPSRGALTPWALAGAALAGMAIELVPIGVRLVNGEPPADAFWPSALRALWLDFLLREQAAWLVVGMALALALVVGERKVTTQLNSAVRLFCIALAGWCLALVGTHYLLNWAFYRGAFLLAPAAMAIGLIPTSAIWSFDREKSRSIRTAAGALGLVALMVITPALPAALELLPTPPPSPTQGYGAAPGPFLTQTTTLSYEMPDHVADLLVEESVEEVTLLTVTWPVYTVEPPGLRVPLGLIFHGYGAPSPSDYTDWTEHLAAKGMVVVHVTYPSYLDVPGQEEPIVSGGRSDHPQHALRMDAMSSMFTALEADLLLSNETEPKGWLMGAVVDPSALYLGGHSLGAGMAMMVAASALERGWATEALAVDLEQPYTHASDPEVYGSLVNRPEATLVHVALSEDDTSVDPCHGVAHAMRWTSEANVEDVVLLQIPSDRHGFPPLIASHYLASTPVHDTLADHGFYRRVDAHAEWLVSTQRGDTTTAGFAAAHLLDHELLTPMGEWSDGTPAAPLEVVEAPYTEGAEWVDGCQDKVDVWS